VLDVHEVPETATTPAEGTSLQYLQSERSTLTRLLPGLDDDLAALPLEIQEKPGNPALGAFRTRGGPALLVPASHGGLGATPLDAVRVQRAVGSRAPSLAVAATMHHFSVAILAEMAAAGAGPAGAVLQDIAGRCLFVASGFAEGRTGAGILSSQMEVRPAPEGLIVTGSKKPCSLSQSMDLLTASVTLPDGGLAVLLLPADTPGIEPRPFWASPVLAGAESDEVVLRDVWVPSSMVIPVASEEGQALQERSFLWFELLIAAAYLGIASGLVERVLRADKGTPAAPAALGVETEGAMSALEGVAAALAQPDPGLLGRALCARFLVQDAVERAAAGAAEVLGGMAFVSSPDVACLLAAARALAFHPPSRQAGATALDAWMRGDSLILG
jgi:alkylation response protein AidB-like acyl-CoA dehydrogenase